MLVTDSKQLQTQQFVNYAILLSVGINGCKLEELLYQGPLHYSLQRLCLLPFLIHKKILLQGMGD